MQNYNIYYEIYRTNGLEYYDYAEQGYEPFLTFCLEEYRAIEAYETLLDLEQSLKFCYQLSDFIKITALPALNTYYHENFADFSHYDKYGITEDDNFQKAKDLYDRILESSAYEDGAGNLFEYYEEAKSILKDAVSYSAIDAYCTHMGEYNGAEADPENWDERRQAISDIIWEDFRAGEYRKEYEENMEYFKSQLDPAFTKFPNMEHDECGKEAKKVEIPF